MNIQEKIRKRYKTGQIVNIRRRNEEDKITGRFKVKIIGFYRYFILTERNGYKECFSYQEFEQLTTIKKGEAA